MALNLYWWVIIVMAVMSWLLAFDVINMRNDLVRSIWNAANALTEPALRPIRRFLPPIGGMDISPIVLLLLLSFIQMEIESRSRWCAPCSVDALYPALTQTRPWRRGRTALTLHVRLTPKCSRDALEGVETLPTANCV